LQSLQTSGAGSSSSTVGTSLNTTA
jgi:hypothetical protein